MRLNKFIAQATGMSRRTADVVISQGRIAINGRTAVLGTEIGPADMVTLDDRALTPPIKTITILLNKPVGYVCSRNGQGSKTIYDLLPAKYHHLKPVGRLDKDSSGLLLLTNDGQLAHNLTHPSRQKQKVYQIELAKPLTPGDQDQIEQGVALEDGPSKLHLSGQDKTWVVTMHEGRNRQIRRTFASLGYTVTNLHRTNFANYSLGTLSSGKYVEVYPKENTD